MLKRGNSCVIPVMNQILPRHIRRSCGCVAALFAAAFLPLAHAGGVHDIPLVSIPLARSPIVLDGSLADWPETRPITIVPIDPGLAKSGSASLGQLRRHPDSATLQAAYDRKALYFGIVWKGPSRAPDVGSVDLHIKTDRIVHVRVASSSGGRQRPLQERVDDGKSWRQVGSGGARCVMAAHADGTTTQEIRIPWSDLTRDGVAVGSIGMAADFAWPGLTPTFLRQLPPGVLHDNTHLTACFLTSAGKLFGRDSYLGSPSDWGDLKFVAAPQANATQVSTLATGATETYVVRLPTPPPVNGRLTGWSPSRFQSVVYAPGFLGDRYSARIATAYDADYLYIATHVKSPGGPLNTEPEATQAGYAGGDCLQVRLNDGQHTVNLCGWYDSVHRKPALTADGNDLKNPYLRGQGAKEAFQIDPDGQGYTQVMAVPWRVLPAGTAPKAGDVWKGTFQVWWSGLEPQFTVLANPVLAPGGGIADTYLIPEESNVTIGIFDAQGHLVRTLIKDAHRRGGRNTEYWDGKDQFGQAVAAGRYSVRGIAHPPIEVRPVVSLGNPGTPPWPTADGRGDWLSDEAAPQGAVTDGTNVYLAAPGSEKGHAIIAVGPDGKRLWGYDEAVYPRCVSLALQGRYLFALFSGPESTHPSKQTQGADKTGRAFILCLDKNTGAPALFSTQKTDFQVATWPYVDQVVGLWDLRTHKTFTPTDYEGQPRYFADDVGEPTEAVGIAAAGGRLYVSMLTQDQLLILDAATGKQLGTIPVPQPVGLHPLADGRLLGVSAGKIVTIDPATKAVTTLIAHDLAAPHDVATDRAGNVYVSDWGASFQVKVFSPGGRFLRAIGTPGGRPWVGRWDPNGMLLPRGIAVTDDGKLWVAEDDASPNRVSVWNAATGRLLRDYLGPAPYGGGANFWVDPKDASTVVAAGTLFHVDYAKKTWTPVATPFRRLSGAAPFTPNGMHGGEPGNRTLVHDGRQYVFSTTDAYQMVVLRRDGDRLTPVAAIGCLGRLITTDGTQKQIWDSDIGDHRIADYYPGFFKGHVGDNYLWVDKNGDGEVQPDEMQWVHSQARWDTYAPGGLLPEIITGWGFGVGPDGTIYLNGFCRDRNVISRLDLPGWSPGGAPLYDLAAARPIIVAPGTEGVEGLYVDAAHHLFVTRPYEWSKPTRALDVYDRDGKRLWSFAAPAGPQQADDFLADNVIGEFREPGGERVLASWLWHGNYKPYLFTADGLYLSSLLDDTKLGPTATWDESYKNYFQAPDGTAYIVNGGNDAYHIDKIVGLDRLHRFSGSISVTASDLKAAAASAQASAAPPPLSPPIIRVAWLRTPPAMDGRPGDLDRDRGVVLPGSRGRSARIALGRDRNNLYLSYEVHGAKLVNKGGDWQRLFISGDCDDLMLHAGPWTPHFAPAEGDERLLLSLYQGRPIAVLYRPVVPGSTSSTRLMGATIDQIVRLTSAKIVYQRSGDGYTLQASVPLPELGIDPAESDALHGDVGVIYADETGANRSLRLYHYNHDTGMMSDLTTEATLQPGNWGDVELPLGPNLLKNGDFEEPLAATPDAGWAVSAVRNGVTAGISDSVALSGSHSLLLQQTAPVTFTPEAYALPDYGEFEKSANGGQGGGYAAVSQRAPVTGGQRYALRFHLRTLAFSGGENKAPGPNRGYVSLEVWVHWEGADGSLWVLNHQDTTPAWITLTDARFNYFSVPMPYTAPAGATSAVIEFSLSDNFANVLPKAYVDDVELAEAP